MGTNKRIIIVVVLAAITFVNYSCSIESAFPDEDLDNYWRLA